MTHVRIVAETRKHSVSIFDGFCRRRRPTSLVLIAPTLGLLGRAIENRDAMTGFTQVACHRIAHDTEAEKCNVFH